jgi:hypothetical protein
MLPIADLPTFLESRAFATWERLREGDRTRIPPHEDGVTADLASSIRASFDARRTRVKRFSGRAEGGPAMPNADWEWWVEHRDAWVGMRFQAKVINVSARSFGVLPIVQAFRLVESRFVTPGDAAPSAPVYRYPFYCFYTAWNGRAPAVQSPAFRRAYGHAVVAAPAVLEQALRGRAVRLNDVAPDMMPLAWLFAEGLRRGSFEPVLNEAIGANAAAAGDPAHAVRCEAPVPVGGRDDRHAAIAQFQGDEARREAATDPERVAPPAGRAAVLEEELPAYVRDLAELMRPARMTAENVWRGEDVTDGGMPDDSYARQLAGEESGLSFVVATRLPPLR